MTATHSPRPAPETPLGRPSTAALVVSGTAAALFLGWTLLVLLTPGPDQLDAVTAAPTPSFDAPSGQLGAAIGVAFSPVTMALVLLGLAWWSGRRRLRNLSLAMLLSAIPGTVIGSLIKLLIDRPRPTDRLQLFTDLGSSYPAAHVSAVTITAVMVIVTATVTRQQRGVIRAWQVAGVVAILAVALAAWLVRSNSTSDLIGGVLLGVAIAAFSLIVAKVRVLPSRTSPPAPTAAVAAGSAPAQTRCAVIYNPSKIVDEAPFRRHIEYELDRHHVTRTLWLPTTVDEPGRGLAEIAVAKSVDLVLVAGGDGTVRSVCEGMADSGVPLGIVPAGTGNLLARNLGIPIDERAAIDAAFNGFDRTLDLVRLRVDDHPVTQHFTVMAGMGFDAVLFEQTDAELKRAVGYAAYFVAGAQAAGTRTEPFQAEVRVDDQPPVKRKVSIAVIGNVGFLQAGIELFPDARPDDGLLDVLVAFPRSLRDWARIVTKVLAGRRQDAQLVRMQGSKVSITTEEPIAYQIDGDAIGHARRLVATTSPGALVLRVPDSGFDRHGRPRGTKQQQPLSPDQTTAATE